MAFILGADDNTVVGGGMNSRNGNYLEFLSSGNLVTGYGAVAGQFDQGQKNVVAQAMQQKQR